MIELFKALFAEKAYAFNATPLAPSGSGVGNTNSDVSGFISRSGTDILNAMTLIAGAAAVFFLIWYGIQYIMAGGSADKAKAARAGIVNAVIGVIIITAAYAVIRFAITVGNTVSGAI